MSSLQPYLEGPVLIAALVVIMGVYFSTLSPTIAGGDSGEIVAEGCQLGTAHPPGYPLITMIIYVIAKHLEWLGGTVASRVNAFSAICTSAACFFIGSLVMRQSKVPYGGALLSMGLFAFSPLIWQYATTAEVFPLNTMFAAALLFLVELFSATKNIRIAYLGAFLCGLALCNQHTIVLYEVPLVAWMLFLLRSVIQADPFVLVKLSSCFIIGLLPYLYLPLSVIYLGPKPGSWGRVESIGGLMHHLLRRDYGTFQLFSGLRGKSNTEGFAARTEAYIADCVENQGLYIAPILALIAVVLAVYVLLDLMNKRVASVTAAAAANNVQRSNKKAKLSAGKNGKQHSGDTATPTNGKTGSSASSLCSSINDNDKLMQLINSTECTATPAAMVGTQLFYFLVFHSLANLPLGDPLLFGVHQRFWMQPNVLLFAWAGIGFDAVFRFLHFLLPSNIEPDVSIGGATTPAFKGRKGPSVPKVSDAKSHSTPVARSNIGSYSTQHILQVLGCILACTACYHQYARWVRKMDVSDAHYFSNYAKAILAPLPADSVLLVNYDQQWTAVRYMQVCEGLRPDVTSIQLSMMTYEWFQTKHELYPQLSFPGTFLSHASSPTIRTKGAFTLREFLHANIDNHPFFVGGDVPFADSEFVNEFTMVPYGIVSRFCYARRPNQQESQHSPPRGTEYMTLTYKIWETISESLDRRMLPDTEYQFQKDTWEWTIVRNMMDRITDTAAVLLETALEEAKVDPYPLINAVYWLESACTFEQEGPLVLPRNLRPSDEPPPPQLGMLKNCPGALMKNAGLGHVHLVQNPLLSNPEWHTKFPDLLREALPMPISDVFHTIETGSVKWPQSRWKQWSSQQFTFYWGAFLRRSDSAKDPQFEAIQNMFNSFMSQAKRGVDYFEHQEGQQ